VYTTLLPSPSINDITGYSVTTPKHHNERQMIPKIMREMLESFVVRSGSRQPGSIPLFNIFVSTTPLFGPPFSAIALGVRPSALP
jgi:hypothetical protein